MAKVTNETPSVPDGVRVLSNGAWQDITTGRLVKGGKPVTAVTTPSQSLALHDAKANKKHKAIQEAANLAASRALSESDNADIRALAGSDRAYLQAIAIGRTIAAIDADSPYGNQAAEWIMTHSGNVEPREVAVSVTLDPAQAEQRLLALIARAQARMDVIDGDVIDTDQDDTGND